MRDRESFSLPSVVCLQRRWQEATFVQPSSAHRSLVYISRVWDKKHFLPPAVRTSSVPCYCSGGWPWFFSVGTDLSRLGELDENSLNPPRQSQQGWKVQVPHWNCFFLYVKSKAHLALNGSLNRYQVFSFAGIKKYVDIGEQMVNWILTLGCTYLGIWALPGWW